MSVYLNRSMDAKEYAYLIRRNAYLEDVSDYQRERIDNLENASSASRTDCQKRRASTSTCRRPPGAGAWLPLRAV
jgi:hypothetical protein